ncbi:MAG: hypothetical protein QM639_14225 [Rhodocyclaceae bacterium]
MNDQTPHTSDAPSPAPAVQEARRRLLRGGLIGAPVVLTLVSRPVLAQETCASPSRAMSGNLSRPVTGLPPCAGRTISYYTPPERCPIKTKDYPFSRLFSQGSYSGCNFGTKTVYQVLNLRSPTVDQRLGQCFTAALFNIRAGLVSPKVLTETTLRNIWNEYAGKNGTYQPFAGGPMWRARDLLAYFDGSGIVPGARL